MNEDLALSQAEYYTLFEALVNHKTILNYELINFNKNFEAEKELAITESLLMKIKKYVN